MPTTSTAQNACVASAWLDTLAGVATDVSGSMSQIRANLVNALGEYLVFQDCCTQRLECGKDATVTLNVLFTSAANEGWDILKKWYFNGGCKPGLRTFSWYLPDKNVGSDFFTGEFLLESLDFDANRATPGPMPVTAVLRPHGCITHSTAAT